jgi:CrcB protein
MPLGTLAVNLSGSLVLGLLVGAGLDGDGYLLAATAGLGSYTTFSTWMFESERLAERGARRVLGANLAVSLVAGVAAVALGRVIAGG